MFANLTGWHLLILLAIVLLVFGAAKLPTLARSVGQSVKIFRGEMRQAQADEEQDAAASESRVATPSPAPSHTAAD